MKITFDPNKRALTLEKRGLDFIDAVEVFAGPHVDQADDRRDYGEVRTITAGFLRDRMVVLVWTARHDARHVISMRYCHADEEERWRRNMG